MLLHHRFVKTAKSFGEKPAFIDRTTGRRITYSRTLVASLILSEKFKRYEDRFLGVMLPTSAGCGLSVLASLMSGRTPVMINYSTGAGKNADYARRKCGFRTIVTSKTLLDKIGCPRLDGMVFIEDIMADVSGAEKLKAALLSRLPLRVLLKRIHGGSIDDGAVILFTSGSEKEPKAVELTHRNISSNIEGFNRILDLSDKDVMLANLPYFHVFGLTVTLFTPIHHGMTIVSYGNPLDYRTVCEIVRDEKPTVMVGTPSFLWGYLRKSERGDFESLRLAVSGADRCPGALREAFLEKHGVTLYEGYGATETSPVISVNCPGTNRPGSVGRVIPGVEVRIEDCETRRECAPREAGRIMVRGESVMNGYFGDPEETSARIRDGWYDTGDMGYLDEDGYLWHAGRLKRFAKIGGEMVSLAAVEDVLGRLLPADSFCVVEVPDAAKGGKIVAAVTERVDERKVLEEMSKHLPNIALPRQFVLVEDLPKMGSGKVDFRAVTDMVRGILQRA